MMAATIQIRQRVRTRVNPYMQQAISDRLAVLSLPSIVQASSLSLNRTYGHGRSESDDGDEKSDLG
jgi:hypothetical protein